MSRAPQESVLKVVVLVLAGFVLVYLGVGNFLAKSWTVTSQAVVQGAPERVAAAVADLGAWSTWSPLDVPLGPETRREVSGQAGAVGQSITWRGPQGTMTLKLVEVTPSHVDYVLRAGDQGGPDLKIGRIAWVAVADGTRIEWREGGFFPDFAARWFGWFGAIQERVRAFQQASLAGLQRAIQPTAK
jgi:hypothetical protein